MFGRDHKLPFQRAVPRKMGRGSSSSQPRSSLYWFVILLVPAAVVVLQYDVLSLGVQTSSTNREFATSEVSGQQSPPIPVKATEQQEEKLKENVVSAKLPDNEESIGGLRVGEKVASKSRTCDGEQHAVDSEGKACMSDLQWVILRSLIYVADKPPINYMACAIPKNGCTYHLAMINRIMGEEDYESTGVVHDVERKQKYKLASRDTPTVARMLANSSIPKYLVVRNPLQRTMSAYLNKVQAFLPEEQQTVENFHKWIYKEFPKGLPVDRSWYGMNPHWMPQMQFCGFRNRDVHSYFKVFKVEKPEEYVNYMYKIIPDEYLKDGWNGEENLSFKDHVLGPRTRTEGTSDKFKKYWNNLEVFDHMARVLSWDIEMLGYKEEIAQMRKDLAGNLG